MDQYEYALQELKRIDEAQQSMVQEMGHCDVMDRAFDRLRRRAIQRAVPPAPDPLSDRVAALEAQVAGLRRVVGV